MKREMIQSLTQDFEAHARQVDSGVEFWLGRDLQHLLGYAEWRNFTAVITKAKVACEVSGHHVLDHFVDANKMVDLGSGSHREVDDLMLTRYACYLIAQNGDPRKSEIAFAQTYHHGMDSEKAISREHVANNHAVRKTLLERGIHPEALPPAEDVKKVERRLGSEVKKSLKSPETLEP